MVMDHSILLTLICALILLYKTYQTQAHVEIVPSFLLSLGKKPVHLEVLHNLSIPHVPD